MRRAVFRSLNVFRRRRRAHRKNTSTSLVLDDRRRFRFRSTGSSDLALPLLLFRVDVKYLEKCVARARKRRGPLSCNLYESSLYPSFFSPLVPFFFFSRISSTDTRHLRSSFALLPLFRLSFSSRLFSLVLSSKTLACLGALIEPRESNVCVRETNLANTNASLGSLFTQNTLSSHLCHTLFPVCVCVCFSFSFMLRFFFIAHTAHIKYRFRGNAGRSNFAGRFARAN